MGRDERYAGGKASWGWVTEGKNAVISRFGMAVELAMGESGSLVSPGLHSDGVHNNSARHLISCCRFPGTAMSDYSPPNTRTASSGGKSSSTAACASQGSYIL